jgi:hypothetical protein
MDEVDAMWERVKDEVCQFGPTDIEKMWKSGYVRGDEVGYERGYTDGYEVAWEEAVWEE